MTAPAAYFVDALVVLGLVDAVGAWLFQVPAEATFQGFEVPPGEVGVGEEEALAASAPDGDHWCFAFFAAAAESVADRQPVPAGGMRPGRVVEVGHSHSAICSIRCSISSRLPTTSNGNSLPYSRSQHSSEFSWSRTSRMWLMLM